jgi:3-oxoacyl-[acyl-carrier protein] reductase
MAVGLGLANAAAVVVGGSRGMGLAAARCLAEDGVRVALVGRTRVSRDSAVADLTDRGSPDSVGFAAEIGDAAGVEGADCGDSQ